MLFGYECKIPIIFFFRIVKEKKIPSFSKSIKETEKVNTHRRVIKLAH